MVTYAHDVELLDDDEEIQAALALQLYKIVGFVGRDCIKSVLYHIEKLFASEDTKVRENVNFTIFKTM